MNRNILICFLFLAVCPGSFWLWTRSKADSKSREISVPVIVTGEEKHLVTPEMAEAGVLMLERAAPAFSMKGTDDRVYKLQDLVDQGPVVLVFIKNGCPCSESAQPFFNNLKSAYPETRVIGVIDVDSAQARSWAEQFRVAYPIIPDPDLELVRMYNVRNSAYVLMVDRKAKIVGYWPGYSKSMFHDLGEALARLSGPASTAFDFSDAPDRLYSGCPFDL